MMISVALAGYLLIGVLIATWELLRKKEQVLDALSLANGYYFLCYSFTPLANLAGFYDSTVLSTVRVTDLGAPFLAGYLILGWVTLQLGWEYGMRSRLKYYAIEVNGKLSPVGVSVVGILLFLVAFTVYNSAFGGYRAALKLGDSVRYGGVETDWRAGAARAFPIVTIIAYFWLSQIYSSRHEVKTRAWVIFAIALLAQLALFPLFSGRGYIINLLLGFFLIFAYIDRRIPWARLVLLSVPIYIIILFGKQFFYALPYLVSADLGGFLSAFLELHDARNESGQGILDPVFKESSHAIVSLATAIDVAGDAVPYTFFKDFLFIIIVFIPQQVLSLFITLPPSVSLTNSQLLMNLQVASLPPGFIGHCVYAAGAIGTIVGPFIYGAFGAAVSALLDNAARKARGWVCALVIFNQLYGAFIMNGDPKVFAQSDLTIPLWLALFLLPGSRIVPKLRHSNVR